jgi:hypothetical protein
MRTILTIVLSILAGAAIAQTAAPNPNQYAVMSDKEVAVQWEKLLAISAGGAETERLEHLRSHGMSEAGAKSLSAFAQQAEREMYEVFKQFQREVCSKQKEIQESGGPEMLAQIIEQQRTREDAARRKFLVKADSLLSPVDQERLAHLYTSDHGPQVVIDDEGKDTAMMVRAGEIPVERAFSVYCTTHKK